MAASAKPALYTPELLALAVELAEFPFSPHAPCIGHARSRTCGSVIELSSANRYMLEATGMKVTACAVGQASAAIFARGNEGMGKDEVAEVIHALSMWLGGTGATPPLPRIEALEPARAHPGRHEAIVLPWRAALDALSKPPAAS